MFKKPVLIFILALFFIMLSQASANDISENLTDFDEEITLNEDLKDNSFNDLQMLIDDSCCGEVSLEKDYAYDENKDSKLNEGILIKKSVVINGKGHIIDAKHKSRIFNIQADNVVIKNITFINAKWDITNYKSDEIYNYYTLFSHCLPVQKLEYSGFNAVEYVSGNFYDTCISYSWYSGFRGGAIYCGGDNLKIINSSFLNNFAPCGGGIYVGGDNAQLIDLIFHNNTAEIGGAFFNTGKNTLVSNSEFDLNRAKYDAGSIFTDKDIKISDCIFKKNTDNIIFHGGNWQIDDINSSFFHSFAKFRYLDFKFNLTHIREDYYNLKITFQFADPASGGVGEDWMGYSPNKKFCLNIDGEEYILQTDSKSEANLNLRLPEGLHNIKAYNPITKLSISKSIMIPELTHPVNQNTSQIVYPNVIKKVSFKFTAKNKAFSKKVKVKKYKVILKDGDDKPVKNTRLSLKINALKFSAKTDKYGKATFKITNLNKKGKFNAKIMVRDNELYAKKVKITVK